MQKHSPTSSSKISYSSVEPPLETDKIIDLHFRAKSRSISSIDLQFLGYQSTSSTKDQHHPRVRLQLELFKSTSLTEAESKVTFANASLVSVFADVNEGSSFANFTDLVLGRRENSDYETDDHLGPKAMGRQAVNDKHSQVDKRVQVTRRPLLRLGALLGTAFTALGQSAFSFMKPVISIFRKVKLDLSSFSNLRLQFLQRFFLDTGRSLIYGIVALFNTVNVVSKEAAIDKIKLATQNNPPRKDTPLEPVLPERHERFVDKEKKI
eukprot:g2352.t1